MPLLSRDLIFLIALTAVGAAWLATHLALILITMSARRVPWSWKLVALIPPATPVVRWRFGGRYFPVLWGVFGLVYLTLRAIY